MKVLVLGGSGMLGKDVISALCESNIFEVYTIYRDSSRYISNCKIFNIDLTNKLEFSKLLKNINPEIIINCASATSVDNCEKEIEFTFNIHCNILNTIYEILPLTKLIFLSTDSIFDGRVGDYSENSLPSPLNIYSKSKLDGEKKTAEKFINHIIIRTNIFGFHFFTSNSLCEWAINSLQKNQNIVGFVDQYFNPIYTKQLSKIILELIGMNYNGLINVGSDTALSKYDFLIELAREFGFDESKIKKGFVENELFFAPRSKRTNLNVSLLTQIIKYTPNFKNGLNQFKVDYQNFNK
jgi:dTDP-4-dehydrorhamnose reductase